MRSIRISDEVLNEVKIYNAKKYNGDVYGKITETVEMAIKQYIESKSR